MSRRKATILAFYLDRVILVGIVILGLEIIRVPSAHDNALNNEIDSGNFKIKTEVFRLLKMERIRSKMLWHSGDDEDG